MNGLYQDLIIDHGTKPRRKGVIENPSAKEKGHNPLCGDQIEIFLDIDTNGVVKKIRFDGSGCAISIASASLMSEAVEGKPIEVVKALFENVHGMLSGKTHDDLGKLEALAGVSQYPMRVKCATLSWHTMMAALKHSGPVSTEEA